ARKHTLTDLIDRYLTDVLPDKGESTVYGQERQLWWWKEQLGHYVLADITPAMVVECRDRLRRGKTKRRTNATLKRYLAVLSHAFTMAVEEWHWCEDNPVFKVRKPKEPRGRVRYLSDQERHSLLQECQASRNPYLYTVVVLALSTGARRGELLGLRWS